MIKINFSKLKANYSTNSSNIHNCNMYFPNTCAIRMSEALVKTDKEFLNIFKSAGTNKCPHSYIRGAQDLGAILARAVALGPRTYGWEGDQSAKVPTNVVGKKGIVCYMKIPGFSGQGHIDLWDNNRPVGSEYWDAETIWMWELYS